MDSQVYRVIKDLRAHHRRGIRDFKEPLALLDHKDIKDTRVVPVQ
jgi:hypothetical protein